jgi:hypothetical protein
MVHLFPNLELHIACKPSDTDFAQATAHPSIVITPTVSMLSAVRHVPIQLTPADSSAGHAFVAPLGTSFRVAEAAAGADLYLVRQRLQLPPLGHLPRKSHRLPISGCILLPPAALRRLASASRAFLAACTPAESHQVLPRTCRAQANASAQETPERPTLKPSWEGAGRCQQSSLLQQRQLACASLSSCEQHLRFCCSALGRPHYFQENMTSQHPLLTSSAEAC